MIVSVWWKPKKKVFRYHLTIDITDPDKEILLA